MPPSVTRRAFLASGAGTAAALAATAPAAAASAPPSPELRLLTSRSGVYTPAKGEAVLQFSFDFPEASVQVGPLLMGFRVQTYENAYAIDPTVTRVARDGNRTILTCDGLLWAGGQEKAPGRLVAEFMVEADGTVQWTAKAEAPHPVKSVTTVVRGLPRGEISVSGQDFTDLKDDEKVFEYPNFFHGVATPLAVLKAADGRHFALSARQTAVRTCRFFFQPGPDGYRIELIHEGEGWAKATSLATPPWRVGPAADYATAAAPHFAHVEKTYGIPPLATRPDMPAWMREVDLVLSIHGAHWTGYIFNDYARILEILRWAATRIDPKRVMVFLPAWDGRYYWNYPLYQPDPRMGGAEGFKRLVAQAQKLGFRIVPMFGTNSANTVWEEFKLFADATTERVDGDSFDLNWVDWDNDRSGEGWMPFMNLGVESWRRWLGARISATITQFGVDGYFLDIAGAAINNTKADMHEGTRLLVQDLAQRHPGIPPVGEMLYDAQMAFIPMSHVTRYALAPAAYDGHVRSYQHLSRPAPGRGSTGVHEAGFGTYKPEIPPHQRAIPTITVVDDTFDKERAAMADYIKQAKAWGEARRK
ncbi:hypothetical protein UAJ10_27430 [Nitrospirillum sp. BR 11164]|uniref:hypothetical protein n=1 Tax=Nitrospirillum sp. BR 11164 TaxID=3104324 RepID=UPI002AFF7334|nr:hypothetical protein [Nitrospirillum sp. BR 11164]MEA1652733.1 hypothetical protein [Nitrospirillum sp. BR 11164]